MNASSRGGDPEAGRRVPPPAGQPSPPDERSIWAGLVGGAVCVAVPFALVLASAEVGARERIAEDVSLRMLLASPVAMAVVIPIVGRIFRLSGRRAWIQATGITMLVVVLGVVVSVIPLTMLLFG